MKIKELLSLMEAEPDTLEHKLKFQNGLTINKQHHVVLKKGSQTRDVVVVISPRGKVTLSYKSTFHGEAVIATDQVKNNKMDNIGNSLKPYAFEEWEELMKAPIAATVEL